MLNHAIAKQTNSARRARATSALRKKAKPQKGS